MHFPVYTVSRAELDSLIHLPLGIAIQFRHLDISRIIYPENSGTHLEAAFAQGTFT